MVTDSSSAGRVHLPADQRNNGWPHSISSGWSASGLQSPVPRRLAVAAGKTCRQNAFWMVRKSEP